MCCGEPGQEICTDIWNNAAHCGVCNIICPDGTACSSGACVPEVPPIEDDTKEEGDQQQDDGTTTEDEEVDIPQDGGLQCATHADCPDAWSCCLWEKCQNAGLVGLTVDCEDWIAQQAEAFKDAWLGDNAAKEAIKDGVWIGDNAADDTKEGDNSQSGANDESHADPAAAGNGTPKPASTTAWPTWSGTRPSARPPRSAGTPSSGSGPSSTPAASGTTGT